MLVVCDVLRWWNTVPSETNMSTTLRNELFFLLVLAARLTKGETDECEYQSKVRACRPVAKGWISLPNMLGHETQEEIISSIEYSFLENVSVVLSEEHTIANRSISQNEERHQCEIQIYQLACAVLTPKCYYASRIKVTPLLPCHDVCQEVKSRCRRLLVEGGLHWPRFLKCSLLHDYRPSTVCRRRSSVLAPIARSRNWRKISVRRPAKGKYRILPPIEFRHNSRADLIQIMKTVALSCPDVVRLYSIGRSYKGRNLFVLEFSDNPGKHESSEPEMKWIGAIHGNEVVGREMLLVFSQFLCREWRNNNERIRRMLTTTRLHIMPSMNPDGYDRAAREPRSRRRNWLTGRFSARGYDLNRHFPDLTPIMYKHERRGGPNHHLQIPSEYWRRKPEGRFPEIYAVIKWIKRHPFVLSAQLHGGDLVANYPYDVKRPHSGGGNKRPKSYYARSPDDQLFIGLSTLYAQKHLTMADPELNTCDSQFGKKGGITNGAAWYTLHGGMQDFNYLHTNCFELTLEIGCVKFPPASVLPTEWNYNKNAIIAYTEAVHWGIKGLVVANNGTAIHNAIVHVSGIDHDVTTTDRGEYWRLLMPGCYNVTVVQNGYIAETRQVEVLSHNTTTIENFTLRNR